jgi:hypothetical protein
MKEKCILAHKFDYDPCLVMSEAKGSYTCNACGMSFSSNEELMSHNRQAHAAAEGAQLRQSEEAQRQRSEQ